MEKPTFTNATSATPQATSDHSQQVYSQDQTQTPVAVVIPARDEAQRLAQTVKAALTLPAVDLVVVVDDGSTDHTAMIGKNAGALVVRHPKSKGKAAAMATGAEVVAEYDTPSSPARHLLFLDADIGESAIGAEPIIRTVQNREADLAIGVIPTQAGAGGHGFVVKLARNAIAKIIGMQTKAPLCGQRCITRSAFTAATPIASGWGVEVGMTIDVVLAGFKACEVDIDVSHRVTGADWRGTIHRAHQYWDVLRAVTRRRLRSGVQHRP